MKNQNTIVNTENCLFYGLPGIIILALSLMASTRISSDFGGDTFIKTVSFLCCNGLLWLLYLAVCQYMLTDLVTLCTLMVKKVRNGNNTEPVETLVVEEYTDVPLIEDQPEQVTVAATSTAESAPVVTKEEYRTYCADFEQKQQDNRLLLVNSILDYVKRKMAPFTTEENLVLLCGEIEAWCDNPAYTPKDVTLKRMPNPKDRLKTSDFKHLVWNIGVRLGFENGYSVMVQAGFIKSLFPVELMAVETESLARSLTCAPDKGHIKLDRPKQTGNSNFHS